MENLTDAETKENELEYLEDIGNILLERCPECGELSIIISGHCKTCMTCGWSACSM